MRAAVFQLIGAGAALIFAWVPPATAQMPGSEPLATCLPEFLHEDASLMPQLMSMAAIWCGPSHADGGGVRVVSGSSALPDRGATLAVDIKRYVEPATWLTAEVLESSLAAVADQDGPVVSHRWLELPAIVTADGLVVEARAILYAEATGHVGVCVQAVNSDTRMVSVGLCRELAEQPDDMTAAEILRELSGVRW